MDGYYDPYPCHFLSEPLVLCGFYGNRIPEIGAWLSSYTGIPFADVERRIEHHLGRSLSLLGPNDQKMVERAELTCLRSILTTQPYPIVALRPQSLLQNKVASLIRKKSTSIHLHSDIFVVFGRVLDLLERRERTRYLDFGGADPRNIRSLNIIKEQYTKSYGRANYHLPVDNRHPKTVAQSILQDIIKIT